MQYYDGFDLCVLIVLASMIIYCILAGCAWLVNKGLDRREQKRRHAAWHCSPRPAIRDYAESISSKSDHDDSLGGTMQ